MEIQHKVITKLLLTWEHHLHLFKKRAPIVDKLMRNSFTDNNENYGMVISMLLSFGVVQHTLIKILQRKN